MNPNWVGLTVAAAPEYIKVVLDLTRRKRLVPAMLEARGAILTGVDWSIEQRYVVDYKEPPFKPLGYGTTAQYEPRDYLKQAVLREGGFHATDAMHLVEYEKIKHATNLLVNRYDRIVKKLVDGAKNHIFQIGFYGNGNAANNMDGFAGLETVFVDDGRTAAADLVANPTGTYNELSMELHQSGHWSNNLATPPNAQIGTDWPEGRGSTDYDHWAPKMVNWSSESWGTDGVTWEDNCEPAIRRTAQWLRHTGGEGGSLLALMAGHMNTGMKHALSARQRYVQTPLPEAVELGFPDVMQFEGIGLYSEFGVPVNTCYVVDVDRIRLKFMTDDMIVSEGPTYDEDALAYKFFVFSMGQWEFVPKYLAKLFPYA